MSAAFYHLLVLVVAAYAVIRGFRRKMSGQIPAAIGTAFGAVCANIFNRPVAETIWGLFPWVDGKVQESFAYSVAASILIFFAVFILFRFITSFIGAAFRYVDTTVLDNISGALFSLFLYLLYVSMAYNFLLSINTDSPLHKSLKSDDGNIVEEVMALAPAVLGCESPQELAHRLQLEDAKRISMSDKADKQYRCLSDKQYADCRTNKIEYQLINYKNLEFVRT